uniref:DNA replication factor Cdt1 n=1 Tax=Timema genevievae TaxID=629358 RepID=A0A7R9PJF4_TIMGE|nr:unnamed protein product [Timema genevievae]
MKRQDSSKSRVPFFLMITILSLPEFLKKLDPPMVIPRSKLFRWHPEFEVDKVAEIVPDELPQPPNGDTLTSARDVLDRAKNLFSYNQRMEKALENVIEDSSKTENAIKSKSDQSDSPLSAALKGLPKALLQKVRAKQAAKALQVMTRSPAQDKEALQYSRLPEIARILRNLFIVEKKGVLPMDFVIEKLGHSYRENLTSFELKEHVHLLLRLLPGWLVLHNIRNTNYLKLSKNGDMSKVTNKLESLAAKKNNLTLLST